MAAATRRERPALLFDGDFLRKLEVLNVVAKKIFSGLLRADRKSVKKGSSAEFADHRQYVAGDDPRHIDWAVTARTGDPHVRDTISDHELELWLVLDTSASHAFGTGRATKHELGWAVAGAFALLASRGGNRIGAATSGTDGCLLPARSGRAHVATVLTTLHRPPVEGDAGDLAGAIERVRRASRRRGMVVVVSDFLGEPTWERPLRAVSSRHEVIAVRVVDPAETELPDIGSVLMEDAETGEQLFVDTHDSAFRKRFAAAAELRERTLRAAFRDAGVDALELSTDDDLVDAILRFADLRKRRSQLAGGGTLPRHLEGAG